MSKSHIFNPEFVQPSKIVGIQFSLLSPEEIRKGSVAEIIDKETYENNMPKIGGLFDPRMGVLERGMVCPTDGLDYMQTPGYFGHLELARPIFHYQYMDTIVKILKMICIKCSKLKLDKSKYPEIHKMTAHERYDYVAGISDKIKRCGDENIDGCGCRQPSKIQQQISYLNLFWDDVNTRNLENNNTNTNLKPFSNSVVQEEKNNRARQNNIVVCEYTPEMVLKIFRRISDEDIYYMGFNPVWSRPEWMICQVLAIPPPAVRPSVKLDAMQRSEDDLTHSLIKIIQYNNELKTRMANADTPAQTIKDYTNLLHYYMATMIDNKTPGYWKVTQQRTGRPFKAIRERLNGKTGRVRGNLMGKRVDFSARSVITADPNLSIRQLGVPIRIAKNITKPVVVNERNRAFLTQLVRNGPDIYPGAKNLEKKTGMYSLRLNRDQHQLEIGDIVHRHLMDGDPVLFNRQPTLHRMSMMCHIVKVLRKGDTFRLNVGCTKPYNADFDGDEMNMHAAQSVEADAELLNLAAVPYQLISPAKNNSIIGIFQDSLLGSYLFSRSEGYDTEHNRQKGFQISDRQYMNLLMMFDEFDVHKMKEAIEERGSNKLTNFDVLSQILPPMSIRTRNKKFDDEKEHQSTSNNIFEVLNGKLKRGQIDAGILTATTNGLIQRICNDYGNMASVKFIDNLQNVVTEYMKTKSFSVGISDLIADEKTYIDIAKTLSEKKNKVYDIIEQVHLGIFENTTAQTNIEEFETQVTNILNEATNETSKIAKKSLDNNNRFLEIVQCGSKGSLINIAQMISSLNQQNVEGIRVPYGFDNRTLPHFSKYDDSPEARGFVENSFISGLTPQELFFHAIAGRIGLIDTAIKTAQTGYLQRRLIKGLEDLKVEYDLTVRNSKRKIVQFSYGDDCFDSIRMEDQHLNLVEMSTEDIFAHFYFPGISTNESGSGSILDNEAVMKNVFTEDYMGQEGAYKKYRNVKERGETQIRLLSITNEMIQFRDEFVKHIFKMKSECKVHSPVVFNHIINNVQGQMQLTTDNLVDISPKEYLDMIDHVYENVLMQLNFAKPNKLFKALYYFHLAPRQILFIKRFNRAAVSLVLNLIVRAYKLAIVNPGEMVGMIAAQSIGEPTTQLTLNSFHSTGQASKKTGGLPRVEEILSLASDKMKSPSHVIYLKPEDESNKERAMDLSKRIEHTKLFDVVKSIDICFDPSDKKTRLVEDDPLLKHFHYFEERFYDRGEVDTYFGKNPGDRPNERNLSETETYNRFQHFSKWIIRMEMDTETLLEKNISMDDIHFAIKNAYENEVYCVYSDFNSDRLIFRIRVNFNNIAKCGRMRSLDQNDEIFLLKNYQESILENVVLGGVKGIQKANIRRVPDEVVFQNSKFVKQEKWVVDTTGTNLIHILGLDYIDYTRTNSNSIVEIKDVLGIEAARQTILDELVEAFSGTYINNHHLQLLCDRMSYNEKLTSISRFGINNDDIGPLAKASFEETPEMFLSAAKHGELDPMRGVSANVMCGQEGYFGTSSFQVIIDQNAMATKTSETYVPINYKGRLNEIATKNATAAAAAETSDICSRQNLTLQNSAAQILNSARVENTINNAGYKMEF